jgi:hypothetical protein
MTFSLDLSVQGTIIQLITGFVKTGHDQVAPRALLRLATYVAEIIRISIRG